MDLANTIDLKESLLSKFQSQTDTALPASLRDRKNEAFKSFQAVGFPTTKHEEYKYLNLSSTLKQEFRLEEGAGLSKTDIQAYLIKDLQATNLVFINGKFSSELSTIMAPESQLEIKSFEKTDEVYFKKYFAKDNYTAQDPFAELNTAFADNGVFIRIAKNKVIEQPVALYYFNTASEGNVFNQPRNLILVEENAQVQFIESVNTTGNNLGLSNSVTEVVLLENSVVDYYKLQNDKENSCQINTTVITLEGKSVFNAATITLNGGIVRNNLNVILKAEYSEATFYGLYFSKDKQIVDNHTAVDHAIPNCQSNELYKGILDDKALGVFNGKIFVKQDAQKTNAFQSNKNILLSKDAVMNTKPQLEIFADDVKCSHGCTIGQLEKEPLFYLRSRGMSEESAKALLLVAFAQDIIDHIKIEPLQQFLSEAIEQRLLK